MKIDPCPCVISLNDGSVHTLFEFRHFLELVEDRMGYDAAKWLRTHVEQAEKAADHLFETILTDELFKPVEGFTPTDEEQATFKKAEATAKAMTGLLDILKHI